MTENEWWSRHVKPRLHNLAQQRLARKIQDVTNKGAPDVDCCFKGIAVKLELKYAPDFPTRDTTKLTFSRYSKDEPSRRTILSREQLRNLEEWHMAGGLAYVLIGVGHQAYLLNAIKLFEYEFPFNDGMTVSELAHQAAMIFGDWKELSDLPIYFEGKEYRYEA